MTTTSVICVATACSNKKNLHAFPAETHRRKSWIAFMRSEQENFTIEGHFRPSLCNDHFEEKDFVNFAEVEAGLARVYILRIDAVPSKHKHLASVPINVITGSQEFTAGHKTTENLSLTRESKKCLYCHKKVYGSLMKHMKTHSQGQHRSGTKYTKSQLAYQPGENRFRQTQKKLVKEYITESTQMRCLPVDLCIKLCVTGQKNSIIKVGNMEATSYPKVVELMCNVCKVLLMEQNLEVIAGRLDNPLDRLARVTNNTEKTLLRITGNSYFRCARDSQDWPEFFTDEQMERAILIRMRSFFYEEASKKKLIEPLWKPFLRLQKYTGLSQENVKVVKSSVAILG